MGYLCGLNDLKKKKQTTRVVELVWKKKNTQEVTSSLALCTWERWEKLWFHTRKQKINVSQVPLRKHICTLSVGRINSWLFPLPFTKSTDGARQRRGSCPGPFHWQHLKVEGWGFHPPQYSPQISHQLQSSKKTNSISVLGSAHRQENKQGMRASALNVIWCI